jgi:hypothetical protein
MGMAYLKLIKYILNFFIMRKSWLIFNSIQINWFAELKWFIEKTFINNLK